MSSSSPTPRSKPVILVRDCNNRLVVTHPNDDESSLSDDAAASQIPKFDVTRLQCKCLEYYALLRADKSNK
jgi:hypothetical protein